MSVEYVKVHNHKGRIVIPQSIREKLGIVSGTLLQLSVQSGKEIKITKVK